MLALEQARGKRTGRAGVASGDAGGEGDPAERVCERLRATLTTFAGTTGFRSLLARALTLAREQEPALAGVHVLEDGSLSGLDRLGGSASRQATRAGQVLVAQLLDLLIILIGEPLTLQLVQSAWPAVSVGASRSGSKGTV